MLCKSLNSKRKIFKLYKSKMINFYFFLFNICFIHILAMVKLLYMPGKNNDSKQALISYYLWGNLFPELLTFELCYMICSSTIGSLEQLFFIWTNLKVIEGRQSVSLFLFSNIIIKKYTLFKKLNSNIKF